MNTKLDIARIKYLEGADLNGCVFIRAEYPVGNKNNLRHYAIFRCQCGKEFRARVDKVKHGQTKSCGCLRYRKDWMNQNFKLQGLSKHRLFTRWSSMIQRCYNPKSPSYKYYGGRGISVCDEWRNDFMAFYLWAVANGWREDLTIDRFPNNDGNYEPQNCRWATYKQQSANKRPSRSCMVDASRL